MSNGRRATTKIPNSTHLSSSQYQLSVNKNMLLASHISPQGRTSYTNRHKYLAKFLTSQTLVSNSQSRFRHGDTES